MGRQATEMLKGVLEGIVLAILSARPAHGYEIIAWLRAQGFTDIAEGTATAGLVLASPASVSSDWQAQKIVRPRSGRR